MNRSSLLSVVLLLGGVACGAGVANAPSGPRDSDGPADASATAAAPSAALTEPRATAALAGMWPVGVDPEVKAAIERYLACAPNDVDCLWAANVGEGSPLWEKEGALSTLLALLDHPDPRVRQVSALELRVSTFGSRKPGFAFDAAQAERVLAAFERESEAHVAEILALDVGCINWAATGLGGRILALYDGAPAPVRRSILARLLDTNGGDAKAVALVKSALTDPDPRMREEALDAFDDESVKKEACDVWLTAARGTDRDDAHHALFLLASGGWRCPEKASAVLDAFEAATPSEAALLETMCKAPNVTTATQQRGAKLGEKWAASTDAQPSGRLGALKAVLACDPKKGRPLAKKLSTDDPDESVRNEAASLSLDAGHGAKP